MNRAVLDAGRMLTEVLSPSSLEHSRRTAATAGELAKLASEDADRAALAGLVHDIARDLSDSQLLEEAQALGIAIHPVERDRPYLLHAQVGARLLGPRAGIDDPLVVRAVLNHTFGCAEMTNLDIIVYLADMIEPKRVFNGVDELRDLAARDLEKAYVVGFKQQLTTLIENDRLLHPRTLDAWNGICERGVRE